VANLLGDSTRTFHWNVQRVFRLPAAGSDGTRIHFGDKVGTAFQKTRNNHQSFLIDSPRG